jgi:predicted transposase YbfD/YdcC
MHFLRILLSHLPKAGQEVVVTSMKAGHGREITWTWRAKEAPEPIRSAWSGTSWIVEVVTEGTREGKPFRATILFLASLRTTPEALLQLVRDRWSMEGWDWIRDTQLHEDAHRYRGNGAGALASLRTAALNLLRQEGFHSIRSGLQAVCHAITALLAMARRQPAAKPCLDFESALHPPLPIRLAAVHPNPGLRPTHRMASSIAHRERDRAATADDRGILDHRGQLVGGWPIAGQVLLSSALEQRL